MALNDYADVQASQGNSPFLDPNIWKTGNIAMSPNPATTPNLSPIPPPPAGPGSSTLPASFGGPIPPGQTPPPSVNPQVVYTYNGQGYNPNELAAAWGNGNTAFAQDPNNARVRDILQQYGTVLGTPMRATPSAAAASPTSPSPSPASVAPGASGLNDPRASAFYDMLMKQIGGINTNVTADDPIIKAQTDAYSANTDRASRSYLAQAAERGGAGAPTDAIARSLAEKSGQATSAFQANLMGQERTQRINELQNMLSLGGSYLTSEQQLALTEELQKLQLSENEYQFNTNTQLATSPFASAFEA